MGATFGGTTAVGGGPIAFAIMTMVFQIPVETARDFSLMCQAAGNQNARILLLNKLLNVITLGPYICDYISLMITINDGLCSVI